MSQTTPRATLDPSQRIALHRRWLMGAALTVVERDGIHRLSVARISEQAHVSRKAFYDVFTDAEDCLRASLEEVVASARREAAHAYRAADGWLEGTRAAIHTLLALAEERPNLARVIVVDLAAGGPALLALRASALRRAGEGIALGEQEPRARTPPPLASEMLAGGIAQVVHERLRAGRGTGLRELTGPVTSMIALAYLGPAAAERELSLAPPRAGANGRLGLAREPQSSAARGLRVTDRTLRVLLAIATEPGASNAQIARAAGIVDQGQVSKLLARLAVRGIAENSAPRGGPKSWRLTELGEEICAASSPA